MLFGYFWLPTLYMFTVLNNEGKVKAPAAPAQIIHITESRRLRFKAKLIRRARRGY